MTKLCSNCHTKTDGKFMAHDRPLGYKILCNKCLDLWLVENYAELDKRAIEGWKKYSEGER